MAANVGHFSSFALKGYDVFFLFSFPGSDETCTKWFYAFYYFFAANNGCASRRGSVCESVFFDLCRFGFAMSGSGSRICIRSSNSAHAFFVKDALVNISDNWCLVGQYRMKIPGSSRIRSYVASSLILWALRTCRSVGFRPLMQIWMAGSLSSNKTNLARPLGSGIVFGT